MSAKRIRSVIVGCGRMGAHHAALLAQMHEFELVGVCDQSDEAAKGLSEQLGVKAWSDLTELLRAEEPESVSICTSSASHAALTRVAAQSNARGIYCEKPMATNLADARAMKQACDREGVLLVVNHQRRVGADMLKARELLANGAIGEPLVMRLECAGDFLSDGSHLVNSMAFLAEGEEVESIWAQMSFEKASIPSGVSGFDASTGERYGHIVESACFAIVQFKSGLRAEFFTGDARQPRRAYHDIEVFGTSGRLWRAGLHDEPNLFLQSGEGSYDTAGPEGMLKPVSAQTGKGQWKALDLDGPSPLESLRTAYMKFGYSLRTGAANSMSGELALAEFEIIMAIYEAARIGARVKLPLDQDAFPLDVMRSEGRL